MEGAEGKGGRERGKGGVREVATTKLSDTVSEIEICLWI